MRKSVIPVEKWTHGNGVLDVGINLIDGSERRLAPRSLQVLRLEAFVHINPTLTEATRSNAPSFVCHLAKP